MAADAVVHLTEEQFLDYYQRAWKRRSAGSYQAARDTFLYLFDNSRGIAGLGVAGLSYLVGDLADLARDYPQSRESLIARRNERETLIRANEANFNDIQELIFLNRCLDGPRRSIQLYNELKKKEPPPEYELQTLANLLWDELLPVSQPTALVAAVKRDARLEEAVLRSARSVAAMISEHRMILDFPDSSFTSRREYRLWLKNQISRDGVSTYEVLLRLDKAPLARRLESWLLAFQPDLEMYRRLAEAAQAAGHSTVATRLREQAWESRPPAHAAG